MSRTRAIFELLFAGAIWGFGFVATVWALRSYTPAEVLFIRYVIALFAGEALVALAAGGWRKPDPTQWRIAAGGGLILAAFILPQTIGLLSTSASKSGFLTTLYILIVPLLAPWLRRSGFAWLHLVFVAIALCGAYLLTGANVEEITAGDLWTLLCAFFAAVHILYVDRVSGRITDSFRFNNMQSLFCGLATAAVIPMTQDGLSPLTWDWIPWAGILWLALFSSMIGFTIQIRTQKVLHPTTASMLFLLESPFALLFGMLFLQESLSAMQLLGAWMILAAAFLTVKFEKG